MSSVVGRKSFSISSGARDQEDKNQPVSKSRDTSRNRSSSRSRIRSRNRRCSRVFILRLQNISRAGNACALCHYLRM